MSDSDYSTTALPLDASGHPIPVGRPETGLTVSVTTGSASSAFTTRTAIRVIASADGFIHIHATESAANTHMPIRADQPESFYVIPTDKVAFYSATEGATLTITPYS